MLPVYIPLVIHQLCLLGTVHWYRWAQLAQQILKAWSTAMAQPVETTTILSAQPFWMMFFKSSWLVFHWAFCCTLQKPSTNIDHSVPRGTRKVTQTTQFILHSLKLTTELWATTLTYNPKVAKVKVDPHAKNQGHRANGSNGRARTYIHTNIHTNKHMDVTKCIISPASRSIIKPHKKSTSSLLVLLCNVVCHSVTNTSKYW